MILDSKDETVLPEFEAEEIAANTMDTKNDNQEIEIASVDYLIHQIKDLIHKENKEDEATNEPSPMERLNQMEENWGMRFSDASFNNSTLIINHGAKRKQVAEEDEKYLLLEKDDRKVLVWCFKHYKDFYFSFFLAICVLDTQPCSEIMDMSREIKEAFARNSGTNDLASDDNSLVYRSRLIEMLGITEYQDYIKVRGEQQEIDFFRLPSHGQAQNYIRLLTKEFTEFKSVLSEYLFGKIMAVYKSNRDFMLIGGCFDALAYIGAADLAFFNDWIIPMFLKERSVGADYCLSLLLKRMYLMKECRKPVIRCINQWGKGRNNPHCTLIALYLCGLIGNQETMVRDIWNLILGEIVNEVGEDRAFEKMSYSSLLKTMFSSGNRNISYYKGITHAFYDLISHTKKIRNWQVLNTLDSVFLLFIWEDYSKCNLNNSKRKKQDMIWIRIFETLDKRTGVELSYLWAAGLKNRQCQINGWKILEAYLSEYEEYKVQDVERLTFFFYWLAKEFESNKVSRFLAECASRSRKNISMAADIYKRLEEEKANG